MARQYHIFLGWFAGCVLDGLALSDQDLGLNDIDAGDLFGDSVFDLTRGFTSMK